MEQTLRQFVKGNLFEASDLLLSKLNIKHTQEEPTPMRFQDYYESEVPQYIEQALQLTKECYYIGEVCDDAINGVANPDTKLTEDLEKLRANAHYKSMMLFAVDLDPECNAIRSDLAVLTRAFNRLVYNFPVTVIFRHGQYLSIGTCERTEFKQEWKQGQGEKLGKVSLLRKVDCLDPHRGHLMILESLCDKTYPTFDDLYTNWQQVFSSELLTRKFYGELSDWYAWAVQVARFPNDLTTTEDDEQFNHESCIRLITRLIFVWFLKRKHLIPEEFFDEDYIREHFIEEFDPHARKTMFYDAEQSKYYRLILQNLFFAMLNRPIVPEGKDTPNNRRFRGDGQKGYLRSDYNVNNLMRYKSDFKDGGAEEFLKMANSNVPFLNGGLFDCLDDKPKNLYYDGFSERKESLEQLYIPDWLFFGDEVGRSIDLSQWYGDTKKKSVSARGIIDILKRYNFTIEENTPLDQEVSLDPELLGKAFENLLASYNPETKTSARKQTGSFYTPREIVQYMVDESLVAHLKRTCGDELEPQYRTLLSYATDETTLTTEQRRSVMQALYNCRVLDPACGSGAFPMGVLQQMVHILRQLDSTNEMWKDFMIDLAIEQSRKAFSEEADEERKARLADIEEAFDRNINDPDYARKLYLIEHCIFGIDIQPIAVQISKLRFFISLVVDQKPTDDAAHNFGIRPLPNLESKFVAANTLIPVKYDGTLVESAPEVRKNKDKLKELNHKIFLAKRNIDKLSLKSEIKETRKALALAIEDTGFVGHSEAELLAGWDMFDQNTFSSYFDSEWMFGVKGGFDIVIGNPPYVLINKEIFKKDYEWYYKHQEGKIDLYRLFIEKGLSLCSTKGSLSYITPNTFLSIKNCAKLRRHMLDGNSIVFIDNYDESVFEASVNSIVFLLLKGIEKNAIEVNLHSANGVESLQIDTLKVKSSPLCEISINADDIAFQIKEKMIKQSSLLNEINGIEMCLGAQPYHNTIHSPEEMQSKFLHSDYQLNSHYVRDYGGKHFTKYFVDKLPNRWIDYSAEFYTKPARKYFEGPRIVVREIPSNTLICAYIESFALFNKSVFIIRSNSSSIDLKYIIAILNSKAIGYYIASFGDKSKQTLFPRVSMKMLKQIPIPSISSGKQQPLIDLVDNILNKKTENPNADTSSVEHQIDHIVYHLYGLTYDEVLIIDPNPPFTREEYETA